MDKAVKRYLAQLRRALTCGKADRERLFAQSRAMLEGFEEENANARYEDLVTAFGQPKDFAAEMLSQLDPGEVERAGRQRKYIRRALVAVIALALISCSVYWAVKWVKAQDVLRGDFYVVETVRPYNEEETQEYLKQQGVNP